MLHTLIQQSHSSLAFNQFNSKDLAQFYRVFKSYLRYCCDTLKADIVSFDTGNYTITALVQRKDGTMVRLSVDDIRRSKNFNMILVRTIPKADELTESRSTFATIQNLSNSILKI